MSGLGQKQTCAVQEPMSALAPNSDRESGLRQTVMSALPPKADMCGANRNVRFGPKADMCNAIYNALAHVRSILQTQTSGSANTVFALNARHRPR